MTTEPNSYQLRVAAVQDYPVHLDVTATLAKVDRLVAAASRAGAELVVFGESFLNGFPLWIGVQPAIDQADNFVKFAESAIQIPGPETDVLANIARKYEVILSIGCTERSTASSGHLWNVNLIFDDSGTLINHRRKLVPTWYEKLVWSPGDGADIQPIFKGRARIGALICGENTNPLARYTLIGQNENVHIATYPPSWPISRLNTSENYDFAQSIILRSTAHSFEGKLFTIAAGTAISEAAVEESASAQSELRSLIVDQPVVSVITDPMGNVIAGPLRDRTGMLIADLNLRESIRWKQIHDVAGGYNRFDVFSLQVASRRLSALSILPTELAEEAAARSAGAALKTAAFDVPNEPKTSLQATPTTTGGGATATQKIMAPDD